MSTRKVKEAKDLESNELIYFKGHAKATYMSDGRSVEDVINSIGSGNVNLSEYVTKEEFGELEESAIRTIQINGHSFSPDPEEDGFVLLPFKTINGQSIVQSYNDDSDDIIITGGGSVDLSNYVEYEAFNQLLAKVSRGDKAFDELENKVVTSVKSGETEGTPVVGVLELMTINNQSIVGSGNIIANAYPRVDHGTSDTTFELTPNTFHVWGAMEELTLTLGAVANDVANEYLFQFTGGSGGTTLVLPGEIKWAGGTTPTIEAFKIHQVSILNNCATIQSFG